MVAAAAWCLVSAPGSGSWLPRVGCCCGGSAELFRSDSVGNVQSPAESLELYQCQVAEVGAGIALSLCGRRRGFALRVAASSAPCCLRLGLGCLAESTALPLGATRSDGGFHELLALFVCSEGARVFL